MKRTKIEDRLEEIENELNSRNGYKDLSADEENTLWLITLLREN